MHIDERFKAQHGVATRGHAKSSGLTARKVDRLVASGSWVREHRGVYRLRAYAPSRSSKLIAAVFAANGVASHRSAALNLGLEVVADHGPEISISAKRRVQSLRGVAIYHTKQWSPSSFVRRHGIRTTSVERTIMDCAWLEPVSVVERLAESAIRQRLTTWSRLDAYLVQHAKRGRNGAANYREMLEDRCGPIPLSDFSRRVAKLLTDAGLPAPLLEYQVRDSEGQHILQMDLAWPNMKKACECDGLEWHGDRVDVERDYRTRNEVRANGWRFQQILWSMYCNEKPKLIDTVQRFLAS